MIKTLPWMIVVCNRCGSPNVCVPQQKTTRCWKCCYGIRLQAKKRKVIYRAKTKGEALTKLIELKMQNMKYKENFHRFTIVD